MASFVSKRAVYATSNEARDLRGGGSRVSTKPRSGKTQHKAFTHTHATRQTSSPPRSMAPSSSPTNAPTRKPALLHVIHDGIFKKDAIRPHVSARQLPVPPAANVHDESWSSLVCAHASNTDEWATGMDLDSIARPEEICELSGDEWDLEEAGWSVTPHTAADETAPILLWDATSEGETVWNEAEECERNGQNDDDLLQLLEDDTASPSSDGEDDAPGVWAAPSFCCASRRRCDTGRRKRNL